MERLTHYNEEYGCWTYRCPSGDAAKHLAAYEDTGMTPGEIAELKAERDAAVADIYHMGGCPNCKHNIGRCENTGLPICDIYREYPNGVCFEWRGPQAERNDPLTLEELRVLDGQPVYVTQPGHESCWALVYGSWTAKNVNLTFFQGESQLVELLLHRGAKIYRYPPKEASGA